MNEQAQMCERGRMKRNDCRSGRKARGASEHPKSLWALKPHLSFFLPLFRPDYFGSSLALKGHCSHKDRKMKQRVRTCGGGQWEDADGRGDIFGYVWE